MLKRLKHHILQHQHKRGTHPGKTIAWVDHTPMPVAYCDCQTTHHITPTVATLTDGTHAVVYHIADHQLAIVQMIEHDRTITCTEAQMSWFDHE